jgi:hypothetical protein
LEPDDFNRSDDHKAMINLILFAILGLVLFGSFIVLALQGSPRSLPDSSAVQAVTEIINLEGSSFSSAKRLLDDTDYQLLCSNPDLRRLAERLRTAHFYSSFHTRCRSLCPAACHASSRTIG